MTEPSLSRSADLDAADPLREHRSRFVGAETPLVYFDGNSLGRPLRVTADRLQSFVTGPWGERLIRGWEEEWFELPLTLGDEIGRVVLGAAPGQTAVADSTTVLLYKAMRAAAAARPGRTEIVLNRDDFPTDRYVAAAVADECGLSLEWIEVDPTSGVTVDQVASAVGEQTAFVVLSHVAYRSAWLADAPEITQVVQQAGALMLWDLSHSVGSVPLALDDWGVDLAVGCTYKYLNGGPGSPAFLYVAQRHQDSISQPIHGWMGHADPFTMGPHFTPAQGMRRFISGTPPIVGMQAMQDMLELVDEVGMQAVRDKSVALTTFAIELADAVLDGVDVASPRHADRRGGHVTFSHPAMREVVAALWQRDVIPDYRDPGGLRVGLSPLSTSFTEVEAGLLAVREALTSAAG